MSDRIAIWRFAELTHGLTRAEAELLRDCLFAQRRADWGRLGVRLRMALNGPEADLPLEFSLFDVPTLRAVLDGVRIGGSPGLAVLQREVGAQPHPDEASRGAAERPDGAERESGQSVHGGSQEGSGVVGEPVVIWCFDGLTQGLNRSEAKVLRDRLLAAPNLAWLALGGKVREALAGPAEGPPLEFTLSDVPVLQAALEAAPLGENPGLARLRQAADAAW